MDSTNRLRLLLTGDSMITRHAFIEDDAPTRELLSLIRSADLAFTNLESLPNGFQGYASAECGGTHMSAASWVLDDLLAAGFDLVSAATNHALDYSIAGLLAALDALESRSLPFAGIGRNLAEARMPAYVETSAATFGLVACTSSFASGQQAADQRPDMPGRPGVNPLRYSTTYEIPSRLLGALREVAEGLGIERQRQEHIESGFAYPPADPAIFPFLGGNFRENTGEELVVHTKPRASDLEAIASWVREAGARSDIVLLSLHTHQQATDRELPAEFSIEFAHRMIEAGAYLVVMHGPHLLRGMEIYRGKPIFYSLGNFICQNDLVYKLPADAFEKFRTDPAKTPSEVFRNRSQDDTHGFPADVRYWQSVMPICSLADSGAVERIELLPIALGHGLPVHRRGRPKLAHGDEAATILERFARLSEPFGTRIAIEGDRATVLL